MRYLSVCAGIEAATVAWHPLGWNPVAFSEIEEFPSAVLAHHYPDVPNYGDMLDHEQWPKTNIDVLVGGTPCQSFSVAGLRKGMADPRGNLALVYLAIADQYRPRWLVWENVPGVLSSDGGRDFGSIIGGMVELGYSPCWRVLDAQYFGVPQRRRRVFVVGYLGDWRRAAEVLFEPESLRRNPAPSREKGQEITPTIRSGASNGGPGHGARSGDSKDELIIPVIPDVCGTLFSGDSDQIIPVQAYGIPGNWIGRKPENGGNAVEPMLDVSPNLTSTDRHAVAFTASEQANSFAWESDVNPTLNAQIPNDTSNIQYGIRQGMAVRGLTPLECERLQGFPDNYTNIPGASDSGQYKALGNSMAVPVMRWIGERIDSNPRR